MPAVALLTPEGTLTADAIIDGERVEVSAEVVEQALGWHLDENGLCRGDVCMPVSSDHPMRRAGSVDLAGAARLVGRDVLIDSERRVVALSVDVEQRRSALTDGVMPEMAFADLDGHERRFSEFGRRKKLLVAFASW